jgi:hypothetical protein
LHGNVKIDCLSDQKSTEPVAERLERLRSANFVLGGAGSGLIATVKSLAGRLDRVVQVCHFEFGRCRAICIVSLPARFPPFLPGMPHGVCKCKRFI